MSTIPHVLTVATGQVPPASLTLHPRNANEGDLGAIIASMQANGFWGSVIVNERTGNVVVGNHRVMAARHLGMPVIPVEYISVDEEQELRILLADNRTARLGHDNDAQLAILLAEMAKTTTGLVGTGYDGDAIDDLLQRLGYQPEPEPATEHATGLREGADPDETPKPAPEGADTRAQVGDIWELGIHRLAVGDSTNPQTLIALLGDRRADALWTDPPYGVNYGDKNKSLNQWEKDGSSGRIETPIEGDMNAAELRSFLDRAFGNALPFCRQGAAWYVASPASGPVAQFVLALEAIGVLRHMLVWIKDSHVLGRSDYHYRHEPIWYGWVPGAPHSWYGDRTHDTVIEAPRPKNSDLHPTMKPVALIRQCIENSTREGDLVLDPFGGSGSTLIACEATTRRCAMVEIDPRYADVIITRWETLTGNKATLAVRSGDSIEPEEAPLGR